jgi:hypothetical protein
MNVTKIANEIFKLAQTAPPAAMAPNVTPATTPDAPPITGEEIETDYNSLPLAIKNSLTKIRLRESMFKKVTKMGGKGQTTYRLYFKQTRQMSLIKRFLKMLETDKNFVGINFQTGTKLMYMEFTVAERAQIG